MKIPRSVLPFLLLIPASPAAPQEFRANTVPMHINVTYYDCILPKETTCIAGTEEDKKNCSRCQMWKKAEFNQVLTPRIDHDAYLYSRGVKPASQFVADIRNSIEEGGIAKSGSKATAFSALFHNPSRYGFLAVEASEPTDGILLSEEMGGVLIRTGATKPTLIHPSDEKKGDLWMNPPRFVLGRQATKLLVPIDPILQQKRQKPSLTWNTWADEPPEVSLKPVDPLRRGHGYRIVLDLSGLAYRGQNQQAVGIEVMKWLEKWLDNTSESTTNLTVLMLADSHFTTPVLKYEMPVDLDKLRAWRRNPQAIEGDPFEELPRHPNGMADFVFGRAKFDVLTTGKVGRAAVTFSVWTDKGRPIDEISATFCVESCQGEAYSSGLMGMDSVSPGSSSDAALHFVQIGNEIRGIFHRSDLSSFNVWNVSPNRASFITNLQVVMKEFNEVETPEERRIATQKFRNVLFPRDSLGVEARDSMEDFIITHVAPGPPPSAQDAPSFYVRMLAVTGDPVSPVPFGLYPLPPTAAPPEADWGHLGFYFRVENPLEVQSYDSDGTCIRKWFLVYADKGAEELEKAADALTKNVLSQWPQHGSFRHFQTMDGDTGFRKWIFSDSNDEPVAAIFILGHHGEVDGVSRIVLNDGDILQVNDVRRIFQKPSIAILNACGTALAGADGFVRAFNTGNVTAVVATKYEVAPAMAVQFAQCLNEQVVKAQSSQPSPPVNLSYAVFEATKCLQAKKPFRTDDPTRTEPGAHPWGARALAYSLLGNGGLRLCTPEEIQP